MVRTLLPVVRHCPLAVVVIVAFAGSAAPALAATGGWDAVQPLSAPGRNAEGARIAVAPNGVTAATWRRFDGTRMVPQATVRSSGTSAWPAADSLFADGAGSEEPQIVVADDGTVTAVWRRLGGSLSTTVQAASRNADGVWSMPLDLSVPGRVADEPRAVGSAAGTTFAIWTRSDGQHRIVQAALHAPGGGWTPPVDLSAAGASAYEPRIAVIQDGTAIATWTRLQGGVRRLETSELAPGSALWSAPAVLWASSSAYELQLAAGGTLAIAAWRHAELSDDRVAAAVRVGPLTWDAPADLSAAGADADDPAVAAAAGAAAIAWSRAEAVQLAVWSPGSGWQPPVDLSPAGVPADDPAIALAPNGDAAGLWLTLAPDGAIVTGSRRVGDAPWSTPTPLSAAGLSADDPHVAIAADGVVSAIWRRFDSGVYRVQAIRTEPVPGAPGTPGAEVPAEPDSPPAATPAAATPLPVALAARAAARPRARTRPRLTGTARVGSRLVCRTGVWSGAARLRVNWLRDGRPIPRATARNRLLVRADRGHSLRCRVTATSRGGTTVALSAARRIGPARARVT